MLPFDPAVLKLKEMLDNLARSNSMGYGGEMVNQPLPAQPPIPQPMIASDQNIQSTFPQQPLPEIIPQNRLGMGNGEPEYDPTADFMRLYQPDRSAHDRLDSIMSRLPQRNKPGIGRKITASLMGFAGNMRGADQALYDPYYNAIEDWKLELDPALKVAGDERMSNTNLRMMANQIVTQKQRDRQIDRQVDRDATLKGFGEARERQGDERVKQGWERLGQTQKGLELRQKLANGGQAIVDSKTGQTYILDKMGNLELLPLDQLSFEEKEVIKTNQSIREEKETPGSSRSQRDRLQLKVNADGSYEVINLDQAVGKGVVKEGTGGETNKPPEPVKAPKSELEKGRNVTNTAREVASSNPEYSKYIKFTKSGQFDEIVTPGYIFGPSKKVYDEIYKKIYGAGPSGDKNTFGTNAQQQNTPAPGLPPVEKRTVGMEFTFPNGNVGKWDGTKWVPVKVVKR